jgi:hypothetical protein
MLASLTGAQVRETAITAQKAARAQFLLDYDTQGALALQESRVLELRREYGLTGAAFDLDQKATSEKAPE